MTISTAIRQCSSKANALKSLDIIQTFSGSNGEFQFPDYGKACYSRYGIVNNPDHDGAFTVVFNGELQPEEITSLNECLEMYWETFDHDLSDDSLSVYESVVIVRIPFRHSATSEEDAIVKGTDIVLDALKSFKGTAIPAKNGKEVEILEYEISDPINTDFEQARKETDSLREDIDQLMRSDHVILETIRTDFEIEEVNPADMEIIQRVSSRIGFCDSVFTMIDGDVVMNSETIRHIRRTISDMLDNEDAVYDAVKQAFNVNA